MLKLVVRLVLALLVVLLVAVFTRPDTFHVERSTLAAAPADMIYPHLADFHRWADWSPWEKLDPAMVRTFEGPDAGVGASYRWTGNDKVGEGRMTILEAVPDDHVTIRLEFIKPFASTNTTRFTLTPEAGGTRVLWTMDGPNSLMSKAMSLVASMDKMIGPDFERGLASLRTIAERAPAPMSASADSAATPAP